MDSPLHQGYEGRSMHAKPQPRAPEQESSGRDPDGGGWDFTQEETTQLIMNAGGINEFNWGLTDEEITQIINARGLDENDQELRLETAAAVEPGSVEGHGPNL